MCFIAVFGLGIWIGVAKVAYHVPQPGTIDFSLFWDAYNKLQQNFITPSKITDQKVVYGAIEGMTNSLGDPYTDFFDPNQAKMFEQNLALHTKYFNKSLPSHPKCLNKSLALHQKCLN